MIRSAQSMTPQRKAEITRVNAAQLAEHLKTQVQDCQFNQARWGVLEPMRIAALPERAENPPETRYRAAIQADLRCGCIAYHAVRKRLESVSAATETALPAAANPDSIAYENPGDYAAYYCFPALSPEQIKTLFQQYPLNCQIQRKDAIAMLENLAATGRVEWEQVLTPQRRHQLPNGGRK